jgi:hypothetical protein
VGVQRGQTSGRVDDNEATIKKRLATFRQETLPVIEFYKRKHLVCSINAERSVDEVYQDVHPVFRKLLMPKKHYHNVVFVLGGTCVYGYRCTCVHVGVHRDQVCTFCVCIHTYVDIIYIDHILHTQ